MSHDFSITPFCKHCGVERGSPTAEATPDCPGIRWFILRALTPAFKVEEAAKRLGVGAYCPRYTVTKRSRYGHGRRGETNTVTRALFPGYVFTIGTFDTERLAPAKAKFLTFETIDGKRKHLTISPQEMTQIRHAEEIASREPETWEPRVGDTVKTLRGLLTVKIAEIKRKRARIEINNRSMFVSISELEFVSRTLAPESERGIYAPGRAA